MASASQRNASAAHRRRAVARGIVRVEIRASKSDAGLIKAVADTLRGENPRAKALRSALERALLDPDVNTVFDVFGADLPDEAFAGVFDEPRQRVWREIDL